MSDPSADHGAPPDGGDHANAPATPGDEGRPRRRWGRRLLVAAGLVVLLLIGLAAAAPWIASQSAVSGYVLSLANDRVRGEIQAETVSLSWFQPSIIRGLRLLDADQQEVIIADSIRTTGGLWEALARLGSFGEIQIESPRVVVRLDDANRASLASAFESPGPRTAAPGTPGSSPLPALSGRVVITDGAVAVTRGSESSYEVSGVQAQLDMNTLDDLSATLQLKLADGTRVDAELELHDLVHGGRLDVRQASGRGSLATDRAADIGALADVLAAQSGLSGKAGLTAELTVKPGDLQATFSAEVKGLRAAQLDSTVGEPLDARAGGQLTLVDNQLNATLDFSGTPGSAQAVVAWDTSIPATLPAAERLAAAVLAGEALHLPEFQLQASADIDLAAVHRALPGLVSLPGGRQIRGGTLAVTGLQASGGAQPAASGSIALQGVTAGDGQQAVNLDPVTIHFDAGLRSELGLAVEALDVQAGFARVQASGTPHDLQATFDVDLSSMQTQMGRVLDLGGLDTAGAVHGALTLSRAGDQQIDTRLDLTATDARWADGGRRIDLPKAVIHQEGHITLAERQPVRIESTALSVDLAGEVLASASGWYDLRSRALQADVQLARADLAFAARRTTGLGLEALQRYAGVVTGQLDCRRETQDGPLLSSGRLTGGQITVDGRPLPAGEVAVVWSGASIDPRGASLSAERVELTSAVTALSASAVHVAGGDDLAARGKVSGWADLAGVLQCAGPLADWDAPSDVSGRLTLNADIGTTAGTVRLAGSGAIAQLVVGSGSSAVREDDLQFVCDISVDGRQQTVTLGKTEIKSRPLSAELQGTIEQYAGSAVASISGRYSASWSELTALLHQWVPATAELVEVGGTSTSEFEIRGPLRQAGVTPEFRAATAGTAIAWDSADVAGIQMARGELAPRLTAGKLTVPATTIATAYGKVQLGGEVDFTGNEPVLRVPGRTPVLRRVAITPRLGRELLGRINPIFYHMASVSGAAELETVDVVLPLGSSLQTGGSGTGRLDLIDFKMRPSGVFSELLALGGVGDAGSMMAVQASGLDFEIRQGRIHYQGFTLQFPEDFDLEFRGSVGFDDTLDLVVSIPVRPALLRRLGVGGSAAEVVELLASARIDIPVVGTRENPRMDLSEVDVKALLQPAAQQVPAVMDQVLKGLLGGPDGNKSDKQRRGSPPRAPGKKRR